MTESELQVFIDSVKAFFALHTRVEPEVGTPYLHGSRTKLAYDFTGVIGISGAQHGCVYFTAPSALLRHVLLMLGEKDHGAANVSDLAGEIANTIAGNARRHFGRDFMISVPNVITGALDGVRLPEDGRSFVIPMKWRSLGALIVVSVSQSDTRH